MSTRIHVVVEDGLLERLEAARGDVPRSRFVTRALERLVAEVEDGTVGFVVPVARGIEGPVAPRVSPSVSLESSKAKVAPSLRDTWSR